MSKSIFRQKRKSNYTIVPNEMLNNKNLSWKAKGMLTYLLSLPDKWEVYAAHLRTVSVDGNDSTVSGLHELMQFKYVWRKPRSGNEPGGWEYLVFDEPQLDDPFRDGNSPSRENPEAGKPASNKETEEEVSKQNKETPIVPNGDTALLFDTEPSSVPKPRKVKLVDDSFIAELKKLNPTKDVDAEVIAAKNWLLAHPPRQFTKPFFSSWINRTKATIDPEESWKPTTI